MDIQMTNKSPRNTDAASHPTEAQANAFDMVAPMLQSAHREMAELSKKKQDGVVNDLKIRHINRLLAQVQEVLGDDPSTQFLETLDSETLPQNSDAVLILGQWLAAMEQFKERHFGYDSITHTKRWSTAEDPFPVK